MKNIRIAFASIALLVPTILDAHGQPNQVSNVACIGHSPYVYRVTPNESSISNVQVGVEDGDLSHYTLLSAPPNWVMSIVNAPRPHDIGPTVHGQPPTPSIGSCPYTLKFSKGSAGTPKLTAFNISYRYNPQPTASFFHDVGWKLSDGNESQWDEAVGVTLGPVHSPTRPNVMLIVLDDVGTETMEQFDPGHTHAYASTPELNQLAAGGIRFRNFYVNPVCSTTRACIQTGRYAFRTGMGNVSTNDYSLSNCEVTIAELIKQGLPSSSLGAAYSCGAFGKWHLSVLNTNDPDDPDDLLELAFDPVNNGYDHFSGTQSDDNLNHFNWAKLVRDASSPITTPSGSNGLWSGESVRKDATSWINSSAKPFFAYVCFNPPHEPYQDPPKETSDLPFPRPLLTDETKNTLPTQDHEHGYRAMIEAVDFEIKYLLEDIKERKENTMIFIVSDNGTPGRDPNGGSSESVMVSMVPPPEHDDTHGKTTVYQLGVRVPMIVYGPLATAHNADCYALVGAVDLWRTIRDLTGASDVQNMCVPTNPPVPPFSPCPVDQAADHIDSISFLPYIVNPDRTAEPGDRTFAFSSLFYPDGVQNENDMTFDCLTRHDRAITDGEYKYIRRLNVNGSPCLPCNKPCDYVEEFYQIYDVFGVSVDAEETFNFFSLGAPANWPVGEAVTAYERLNCEMNWLSEF